MEEHAILSPTTRKRRGSISDAAWQSFPEQRHGRASTYAVTALRGGSKTPLHSLFCPRGLFAAVLIQRPLRAGWGRFFLAEGIEKFAPSLYALRTRFFPSVLRSGVLNVYWQATAEDKTCLRTYAPESCSYG